MNYIKIKVVPFNIHLVETMSFVMDKSKSKYLNESTYSTEVHWDISDLPFVQNNDCQN